MTIEIEAEEHFHVAQPTVHKIVLENFSNGYASILLLVHVNVH